MKKVLLLATAFTFAIAAMSQSNVEDVAKFNTEKHDFGKIKQGNPVSFYFEIKNVGDKPLVVESTQATCGCTTPEKPTEPIMPGESGKIKVVYNAAALSTFSKSVTIKFAGIEMPKMVHITGEVLTPDAYEEYVKTLPKDSKPKN